MAKGESDQLLRDFLKKIAEKDDTGNENHLNIILPFWNERKGAGETRNYIDESIIQAEKKGFHFFKHANGFVALLFLPKKESETRSHLLEKFYHSIGGGKEYGGKNALKYLIGELIDNIYQHSHFSNAYVGIERYNDIFLICICDDGITIKESLKQVQPSIRDGGEAIIKALRGISSKNDERGWGLSSTVEIARNGYHAEILVVSSDGAVWIKNNNHKVFNLEDKSYNGTLIEFRMFPPIEMVDIYDYI